MMRARDQKAHYMGASDEKFELVHEEAYKWNRVIIYDGSILHSAHLDQQFVSTDQLSCDPNIGRLTASLFLILNTEESP